MTTRPFRLIVLAPGDCPLWKATDTYGSGRCGWSAGTLRCDRDAKIPPACPLRLHAFLVKLHPVNLSSKLEIHVRTA